MTERFLRSLIICLSTMLLYSTPAKAQSAHVDAELPATLSLFKLPKQSFLRVQVDFRTSTSTQPEELRGHGAYIHTEGYDKNYEFFEGAEWGISGLNDKGTYLRLKYENSSTPSFIHFPEKNNPPALLTVGDFHKYFGKYLRIVYHDPADPSQFEGMPSDVVRDLVMRKIIDAIKSSDYDSALPYFVYLEKHESALPESFYYHYMETTAHLKQVEKTRTLGLAYVKKFGRTGKYYSKVLDLINAR